MRERREGGECAWELDRERRAGGDGCGRDGSQSDIYKSWLRSVSLATYILTDHGGCRQRAVNHQHWLIKIGRNRLASAGEITARHEFDDGSSAYCIGQQATASPFGVYLLLHVAPKNNHAY